MNNVVSFPALPRLPVAPDPDAWANRKALAKLRKRSVALSVILPQLLAMCLQDGDTSGGTLFGKNYRAHVTKEDEDGEPLWTYSVWEGDRNVLQVFQGPQDSSQANWAYPHIKAGAYLFVRGAWQQLIFD
jgi:hypothetical protein